jgi:6-phosphofructokinase 1
MENVFTIADFIRVAKEVRANNKRSIIFVISERIYGIDGRPTLKEISKAITEATGIESRSLVVGHLQRGAVPVASDRV